WAQGSGPVMGEAIPDNGAAVIARPPGIHVLSADDHQIFTRAFALAAEGDWGKALSLGDQGHDTVARQLLQWRYALDRNSGAKFADIDEVIRMASNWPSRGSLYARAEAAITRDMSPSTIVQWFAGRLPASPIGYVRLGEALVATGDPAQGTLLIRKGWSEGSFDEFTESDILQHDTAYLTPESDRARLDALLWLNDTSGARRQMNRVDSRSAAVARARIALGDGLDRARPALAAVEGSNDPALLFDWSRALRADREDAEAHAMLLKVDPTGLAREHTQRWWNEVAIQARDALADGDTKLALELADHGEVPIGDQYVDQQFLSGFIALRYLHDPERALIYFQRLANNVTRPLSKSRGEYWEGRTYEALGDPAPAYVHYRLAAAYPETYYGQLAIVRTEAAPTLRINDSLVEAIAKREIENDSLMPEMRVLADLDQITYLRLFAEREAEIYSSPAHLKAILETLTGWGYRQIAVRMAKEATYTGVYMPAYAFPLIRLPAYQAPGPVPEPPLVLALIRQETEFDPEAVSSAGAMGLMQVMQSAAKSSSKAAGLRYRPGDLLIDPEYNIQLGMIEFSNNYARAEGSLVLAIAGYNAGPGNVRKWLAENGDPRDGKVDAIDWIEEIPFGETRNYVERVIENMEVYRTRLAGRDMPLTIMTEIYAPVSPPNGPVLGRPPPPAPTPATTLSTVPPAPK
ncbi:MAG TPA: lytic transglycosylase domain-containing protein, partial [Rhizomicrobium sp.]|nr:lytic transglycosylase domain-containing protein [Rhizomicrobium sp.]